MVVNSYVISVTEFGYFFFNCRYLKAAMYCFVGNIQGASIKDLRVFDWNRWRISMLELFAVSHSWIP